MPLGKAILRRRYAIAGRYRLLVMASAAILSLASCENMSTTDGAGNVDGSQGSSQTDVQIADSFLSAARQSERIGDYVSAAGYWQNLLDRDPTDAEAAIGLADNLRRLGQFDYAINVLNSALAHHPDDPKLLSLLGRALVADGNATAALEPLQRSAAAEPDIWETQAALGVAYGMLGQIAQSDEANMRALAASPGNPKVLNNMGLQAAMEGNLDGAIDLLERANQRDEADGTVRLNLALLYAYRGDMARAEALVREELTVEQAEQNMAYFRTLAGNDLEVLDDLVALSNLNVEAETLAPLPGNGNGVAATSEPEVVVEQADVAAQVFVVPTEEVVIPASEIIASATSTVVETPELEPAEPMLETTSSAIQEDMGYVRAAEESADAFVLPPEAVVTGTDVVELPSTAVPSDPVTEVEPTPLAEDSEDVVATIANDETFVLEMMGSITMPAPETGGQPGGQQEIGSEVHDADLPTDNALDNFYSDGEEN